MKRPSTTLPFLVLCIAVLAGFTASMGIFSGAGPGPFSYETIRGRTIEIYGKGVYQHMSADVAIQGIAQDYVTLFAGIPLLLLAFWGYRKGSVRHHFLLSGVLGYFFVTFLFYTAMGMYNILFLAYTALLGLSFFGLLLSLLSFDLPKVPGLFSENTPRKLAGGFLGVIALSIGFLWLGIIVPPLLDGTVYPPELEHYTTLIVQGFDLGLLLPLGFVVGLLLIQGRAMGYLGATTYLIFLSLLMTALTAKVIAMALQGVPVIPVIFIIPTFNLLTVICAGLLLRSVHANP